jgi:hypothetical protein
MNIDIINARWILDLLPSEEIPGFATEALTEGLDTPSLRILAGFNNPILSEIGPIFEKALHELGVINYSRQEAALLLAHFYAKQIVDGTLKPYEGASKIWREASDIVRQDNIHSLDPFIYWADEYESSNNKARQKECEKVICENARYLLENK